MFEYSGEDDFDQINVQPIPGSTNNQNGRFQFTNGGTGGTGVAMANAAMGAVHELRRDWPARADQVAGARDRHVRAGFLAADAAT